MQHLMLQDKYPIFTLEIPKSECRFATLDAIMDYLKGCVDEHPISRFIAMFDHYEHTKSLKEGEIADDILGARHIVFCFGTHLPNPRVMAVRPRSIGVVEKADSFVISYLEAPMPLANNAMSDWVKALAR